MEYKMTKRNIHQMSLFLLSTCRQQNFLAKAITPNSAHQVSYVNQPMLYSLSWQSIEQRIHFKICFTVQKVLQHSRLTYLQLHWIHGLLMCLTVLGSLAHSAADLKL